jgi:hypothetical protein
MDRAPLFGESIKKGRNTRQVQNEKGVVAKPLPVQQFVIHSPRWHDSRNAKSSGFPKNERGPASKTGGGCNGEDRQDREKQIGYA